MSLNEIKKELRIAGKGHIELREVSNPVKRMRSAKNVIDTHMPENARTCKKNTCQHFLTSGSRQLQLRRSYVLLDL
jgi:hypothetical protein